MKGGSAFLVSLILATYVHKTGAQGTECENATKADIVFLVDGSTSIGPDNFEEVRQFLRSIITVLDVGPDKIQIGLVQYSDDPHQEFLLKDHTDKDSLLSAVENINYRTGGTYTGKAMDFLQTTYFTQQAGSRASDRVPQIAVIITDGDSADDAVTPAQRLRQQDVIVFAIGVGQTNRKELESIANKPPERFLATIDNFQTLQNLTDSLLQTVCVSVIDQTRALAETFSDIFFLVDSGITQQQFNIFKSELTKLISLLKVKESGYRVGLAQYGEDVNVAFRLNSFKNEQQTLAAVRRFRLQPQPNKPRNLGRALEYANTHFFSSEAGGRADQGFQQFLVIVAGKKSDDSVHQSLHHINEAGINVIAMSAGAPKGDLDGLTSPHYTFNSLTVSDLGNIVSSRLVVNVTEDCKGANLFDIVFIVDASTSIGVTNFHLIRNFLSMVVSGLDVGPSRVQVGIVTYSDNARAESYLNTFTSKQEILQFIKILPYSRGGTMTGAALKFAQAEIFSEKKGQRKDVQQVAVVITDGESSDSVSEAAKSLRSAVPVVYAVGVGNASKSELMDIASYPTHRHVFSVDNFTSLKPLQQRLQQTLCSNILSSAFDFDKGTAGTAGRAGQPGLRGESGVLLQIDSIGRTGLTQACRQKYEADIFFLMDDSGSIENSDFQDMVDFIVKFFHSFRIGPEYVRMGLVKFASSPALEFDLTTYTEADRLERAVRRIRHAGGGTETGKALSSMEPYFKRAAKTRGVKVPEYLIVITDGEATDAVKAPAALLRAQGVTIYAIGVKGANQTQLLEIAGDNRKTFFVTNFDSLKLIDKEITTDICSPDVCKDVMGDVFFLTDSSWSISTSDYEKMKDFMKSLIGKTSVGQDEVRVGVMQYSTEPKLEFALNDHNSKDELLKAIDGMRHMQEYTYTGKAIKEVTKYFDLIRGGRPNFRQWLIVITDGEAQDDVKGPAEVLRAKGVMVYSIGVASFNKTQLLEISGSADRVFTDTNFDGLKDLENSLTLKLCDPKECTKVEKADIIFLVDDSTSISASEFRSMQKFMESIVNRAAVGTDLTRFGVILYSNRPRSIFTLKQCSSKRQILETIANIRRSRGITNTGEALKYSQEFFNADYGGRKAQKVPQILMVITDGNATDHDKLKPSSDTLRQNGVSVLSVGVKKANRTQLMIMAGEDESNVFYVTSYDDLETLYKKISPKLCTTSTPKSICKSDTVFLLDRSGSITSSNHTVMKNFTAELLKSFSSSQMSVHVGVAQFSKEPQDEFYLNQYSKIDDSIQHILQMKYKGGDTNIGTALEFIQDYFLPSRGSRSGIPKNLLLISDGDSHDEVEEKGTLLRALGINVFAIGVGNVHLLQLLQITGTPERVFSVWTFDALASIKKAVVDKMCDIPPPEDCSTDIAIGFDVSQRVSTGGTLVSGQNKLRTFLPDVARYISSLKGLCCIAPATVSTQMAFQVVDRDGRLLYDTNFEAYSEDVVRKVMDLEMSRPTSFNAALLNSFKEKFKSSAARVKVLVIFSDGLDDDVMKLEQESDLLQQSGVNALLVVALEGVRDPTQLRMVEFGRGFGYKHSLSIGMPSVASTILEQIDGVSNRECCGVMCKCSGHEGNRGPGGIPGPKGSRGSRGQPGFPGEEGVTGERGFPGVEGAQGVQGCAGARGQKGNRGVSGDRGENGEDGLDGIDGEQGLTGADGGRGERGHPGNPGIPGIRGEAGLKGERGLRGDPGEPGPDNTIPGAKGEAGNPGLPGSPGPDGRPGESGVNGNQGPEGRRGAMGTKGAPGRPGSQGPLGSPGASGPQGRRGARGGPGPEGVSGFPGPQGAPGPAGAPGLGGRRGANGQKGQPGDPGLKGATGSGGPRGAPGDDGRDGYGPPGPKGAKGDPGFPGYPGLPGDGGTKGSTGYPGRKGNQGRPGNSGRPGQTGVAGNPGDPGHRGTRGPPGGRGMTDCQLIGYIRDNCVCSIGRSECPAYPTELVFALDMSEDVTPAAFERQRSALLSLLEDIAIAENNCPTGAHVAVVGFSAYTKHLIRFHDYRRKTQLIESVKAIALERTSSRRQLGAAMRFVGQHVFKRVRAGLMMRKVAVFLSNGPTQDTSDIVTAMMEYRALNIVPVVVSLRNAAAVSRAMEVDDTGASIFTVLGRDMAADLRKVKDCAVCYDPCRRSDQCAFIQEQTQDVDLDLVMVADGSREMQADEFAGVQQLLGSVVEQLAVSSEPRRAGSQARVALVQQSGGRVTKPEFGLVTYPNQEPMKRHLVQTMKQQGGSSALGQTLEFCLQEVLLKAVQPRRKRALLAVVGTQTAYEDRAKLRYISQKAKCEGVAVFVATVGERYDRRQVEELASAPLQQHLIHLGRLRADEQGYGQRFFRVFLSALSKNVNSYPPALLKQTCSQLKDPDDAQTFVNDQESAALEDVEKTPRQTQSRQLKFRRDSVASLLAAAKLRDACFLRQDAGGCQNYQLMWFFDSARRQCAPFWYSGCRGNRNRFASKQACESFCLRRSQ